MIKAPIYPPPSPDDLFPEGLLKLVVMQNLMNLGVIDLGTPQQFAEHVLGRKVDLEKEGYEILGDTLVYLLEYPLTQEQLSKADALFFDGGLDIYRYAYFHWDGEDGIFDVRSFAGLENCPNIAKYEENSMVTAKDLMGLAPLKKLTAVALSPRDYAGLEVLLQLPELRSVSVFRSSTTEDHHRVLDQLKARGVSVKVY